jgi:hypothetical protein
VSAPLTGRIRTVSTTVESVEVSLANDFNIDRPDDSGVNMKTSRDLPFGSQSITLVAVQDRCQHATDYQQF